ncbi:hypothetical protein LJC32_01970 [Oscillospiraceae bacterium OttesenSCG-928-F05]|nr:hypothetical protein [Oscillospiraceae bacterium OttesenSCG-928-F05]
MKNLSDFMAVDKSNSAILGKLLYYSLSNILIERDVLNTICTDMGIPVSPVRKISAIDAFKRATAALRLSDKTTVYGEPRTYKVYCRDNKRTSEGISRELVKEVLGERTNEYTKLANITYEDDIYRYEITDYDSEVDAYSLCAEAGEKFELYKRCAGLSQISYLTESFLSAMESISISIHGRLYFVPRKHETMVDLFEDFVECLSKYNLDAGESGSKIIVNSTYLADDEKQRGKMADEFLSSTRQEIRFYIDRINNLIETQSTSTHIMDRWINKVQTLEDKKKMYESILRRDLNDLGEEYATLRFMTDELSARTAELLRCA